MGLMKKPSPSIYESSRAPIPPAPDPSRFVIHNHEQIGRSLIVSIVYPDCTTYEGRKVLVFADATIEALRRCQLLDPHFTNLADVSQFVPVARFEPTERGWRLARVCAAAL